MLEAAMHSSQSQSKGPIIHPKYYMNIKLRTNESVTLTPILSLFHHPLKLGDKNEHSASLTVLRNFNTLPIVTRTLPEVILQQEI